MEVRIGDNRDCLNLDESCQFLAYLEGESGGGGGGHGRLASWERLEMRDAVDDASEDAFDSRLIRVGKDWRTSSDVILPPGNIVVFVQAPMRTEWEIIIEEI